MKIHEIEAKSILRKSKKIDSWFMSYYGMNIYRGCVHDCVYCDGRSEKYQVHGNFAEEIAIKINAIEILNRELNPERKRKPFKRGYILLGGGVADSYQPAEEEYEMIHKVLQIIEKYNFPVHILTKSILVRRDLDILKRIHKKNGVLVSFSFSSMNKKLCNIFEPGVPSPGMRLALIKYLRNQGIPSGIFLMPVIPFLSDSPKMIEQVFLNASKVGVQYIIFGGMTLKEGRQKDYFMEVLRKNYPELENEYEMIYRNNKWGNAISEYSQSINQTLNLIASHYKIPLRIPDYLWRNILSENDRIIAYLEQIDYLLKLKGSSSPYGYAAYSLSKLDLSIRSIQSNLMSVKGVGRITQRLIKEIIETGTCKLYKSLNYL